MVQPMVLDATYCHLRLCPLKAGLRRRDNGLAHGTRRVLTARSGTAGPASSKTERVTTHKCRSTYNCRYLVSVVVCTYLKLMPMAGSTLSRYETGLEASETVPSNYSWYGAAVTGSW